MAVTELLSKVISRRRQREVMAVANFDELVRRLAGSGYAAYSVGNL